MRNRVSTAGANARRTPQCPERPVWRLPEVRRAARKGKQCKLSNRLVFVLVGEVCRHPLAGRVGVGVLGRDRPWRARGG
ncbi:hypothetical protein BJ973_000564 [Actinoplanes tereljensis]